MSGGIMTDTDKGMMALDRVIHPHPVASVATLAFKAASIAANYAFSSVYKCEKCGKTWREWFEE
jgi:hypothetical protein